MVEPHCDVQKSPSTGHPAEIAGVWLPEGVEAGVRVDVGVLEMDTFVGEEDGVLGGVPGMEGVRVVDGAGQRGSLAT